MVWIDAHRGIAMMKNKHPIRNFSSINFPSRPRGMDYPIGSATSPDCSNSFGTRATETSLPKPATGIRFGAALILLASMFYIAYSGAIYGQIRRIQCSGHTAAGVALAGGAVAAVTFMIPAMLWAVTAFRPDRSPEATQTLNDVAWFIVVMPWARSTA